MGVREALQRVLTVVRQHGVLGVAGRGLSKVYRAVVPRRERPHPFDVANGMETGGLLAAKKIVSGHAHDSQTTAYFGSQPSVFRALLERWSAVLAESGQHPSEFTFVDIGCGKGRVLMLASEFPFRRIVGIELSPMLAGTARENLRRWELTAHACGDFSVIQADVLDVPLPDGPALLFLYHPFEGELFERWVASLAAALRTRTAPLYLAYMNPWYENLLAPLTGAQLLWTDELPFTAEEAAAHLFGGKAERVSLYRLTYS